jgi:hypothetical protein
MEYLYNAESCVHRIAAIDSAFAYFVGFTVRLSPFPFSSRLLFALASPSVLACIPSLSASLGHISSSIREIWLWGFRHQDPRQPEESFKLASVCIHIISPNTFNVRLHYILF